MAYRRAVSIADALKSSGVVTVRGWVYRKRELKDKIFLVLRDSTGILQLVFARNTEAFDVAQRLNLESSLVATGLVRGQHDRRYS